MTVASNCTLFASAGEQGFVLVRNLYCKDLFTTGVNGLSVFKFYAARIEGPK